MNRLILKGILYFFGFVVVIGSISYVLGWFGSAATVAKKEFGPQVALKKYEWFINASNQLNKQAIDIELYQAKIDRTCTSHMDRLAREQCMVWEQELIGVKSNYNSVVAEYNSQSEKFNWSLFNTKNLPTNYTTK